MEKLVILIIFAAISAISGWLKKRGQSGGAQDGSNPPPPTSPAGRTNPPAPRVTAPRPVKPTSWEEELRRLLEGEDSPTPAAPPRVPPIRPVVITPTPLPPVAPPQIRPVLETPRPVSVPPPIKPAVVRLPTPTSARTSTPVSTPVPVAVVAGQGLAPMVESQRAYAKASQIDKVAAERLDRVSTQPVQLTQVLRSKASPEVISAVSLIRVPQSARQAIMASIILSPPKALED